MLIKTINLALMKKKDHNCIIAKYSPCNVVSIRCYSVCDSLGRRQVPIIIGRVMKDHQYRSVHVVPASLQAQAHKPTQAPGHRAVIFFLRCTGVWESVQYATVMYAVQTEAKRRWAAICVRSAVCPRESGTCKESAYVCIAFCVLLWFNAVGKGCP